MTQEVAAKTPRSPVLQAIFLEARGKLQLSRSFAERERWLTSFPQKPTLENLIKRATQVGIVVTKLSIERETPTTPTTLPIIPQPRFAKTELTALRDTPAHPAVKMVLERGESRQEAGVLGQLLSVVQDEKRSVGDGKAALSLAASLPEHILSGAKSGRQESGAKASAKANASAMMRQLQRADNNSIQRDYAEGVAFSSQAKPTGTEGASIQKRPVKSDPSGHVLAKESLEVTPKPKDFTPLNTSNNAARSAEAMTGQTTRAHSTQEKVAAQEVKVSQNKDAIHQTSAEHQDGDKKVAEKQLEHPVKSGTQDASTPPKQESAVFIRDINEGESKSNDRQYILESRLTTPTQEPQSLARRSVELDESSLRRDCEIPLGAVHTPDAMIHENLMTPGVSFEEVGGFVPEPLATTYVPLVDEGTPTPHAFVQVSPQGVDSLLVSSQEVVTYNESGVSLQVEGALPNLQESPVVTSKQPEGRRASKDESRLSELVAPPVPSMASLTAPQPSVAPLTLAAMFERLSAPAPETSMAVEAAQKAPAIEEVESMPLGKMEEGELVHEVKGRIVQAKQMIRYLSEDIKEAIEAYKPPLTRVTLELKPEAMGTVEVTLLTRGQNLQVTLLANPQALTLLYQNSSEFRANMESLGFQGLQMNFGFNGEGGSGGHAFDHAGHHQERALRVYEEKMSDTPDFLELTLPMYG
ncbi:MAG: flagellar hook-length control protein FliK [Campylobacterales bacterium]